MKQRVCLVAVYCLLAAMLMGCGKPSIQDAWRAVKAGDAAKLDLILDRNPQLVRETWSGGATLLFTAVGCKNTSIVRTLLDRGADPNERTQKGWTPLHYAAIDGDEKLAKLLLAKGANPSLHTPAGDTPLALACCNGSKILLSLLLVRKDDVSALNEHGYAPMHIAARDGNRQAVEFLLSKGANIDIRAKGGMTPLAEAALYCKPRMFSFLISKGADVHAQMNYGNTLLHMAASGGNTQVADVLLATGVDVDVRNSVGSTPLMFAANKHLAMVRFLLDHGAEPNAKWKTGWRAMHYAASKDRVDIAKALAAKGALVDPGDKDGSRPLHAAAFAGSAKMTEWLLDHGASLNAPDNLGTPLYAACLQGKLVIVKLLVERGANVNAIAKRGKTPLRIARERHHSDIADFLTKHGGLMQ